MITPLLVIQVLFFIVVMPFLPLLISWRWDWWEAWVYALIVILGFVISRLLMAHRHPDLVAERAQTLHQEDAEPWDKRISPLLGASGVLLVLIAGLDMRFGWSPAFSLPLKLFSLLLILAGNVISSYALVENRFFSGSVRLQQDRGQHVVSSGPYRWVRHPGYAGALLYYLAVPFFLDSSWTMIPAVCYIFLMVIRTRLEDKFLSEKLEGYSEYAKYVRYRLLPGIW